MQNLSFYLRMFGVDKKKYLPFARFSFLRNGIGMISEFHWDDFGMILGFSFVKIERVLACLRVQSYNVVGRIPNFLQFCGVSKS